VPGGGEIEIVLGVADLETVDPGGRRAEVLGGDPGLLG
jgi:hypothetical protein